MSNSEEVSLEELLGLTPPKTPPQQKQPAQEKTPQNPTPQTPKQLSIQERRNKVIALILQRVAVTDIAKQLNVDRSTIYADFEDWVKTLIFKGLFREIA
jgi:DNA-binding NarL/FixJ family response regulator